MIDIAALAKRLRTNPLLRSDILAAADALEAQAKEIKTCQQTELTYITRVADMQREYSGMQAKLEARIAELKAVLKPFAFREPFQLNLENGEDSVMAIAVFENDQASARAALKGEKG